MSDAAERIPVIVGVGQVNDRPDTPEHGLDSGGLMVEALQRADTDAGGGWLRDCDSLALVTQLSWPQLNPLTERVAQEIDARPGLLTQTAIPSGDSPILLLNEAANRIGAGNGAICVVAGGEALRTAAQLARARATAEQADRKHDPIRDAPHRVKLGYRQRYGLTIPVDLYPLFENASRASYGQSIAEAQAESGSIWERMSHVAVDTESAWIRKAVTASEIITPSAENRPIAFPYTKLQVANSGVNQGAAFIVASLAEARRRGIAEDRLVYVGAGAAVHMSDDFLAHASFAHSAGMTVSLNRALALNGLTIEDIDLCELYSCFPCIPKMARRAVGWPVDRPATVFGGLTFGGGPIGNYMSHAVACMVDKLREEPGKGLLFANGGYAAYHHSIILRSTPNPDVIFPQDFDYQDEADAAYGPLPEIDEHYLGPATIETYTVHYQHDWSPRLGTIVARTPDGKRTLAAVLPSDEATISYLTDGREEPVGSAGMIVAGSGDLREWRPA